MVKSEKVIIDGIDVSECNFRLEREGKQKCECTHATGFGVICDCENWHNCYFKQLKRLQEENKELKDRNANLRLNLATYDLPEVKKVLTDWRTGKLDRKFKKLQEENKNLKYEIDRHKDTICYLNNHDMCLKTLIKYKKALEEIRSYCDEQNLKADYTACYITNRIDEVLNDQN